MKYDDEALERALAALELEEAPLDLHQRIMEATVLRPQPVMRGWELWTVGIALAVATWLVLVVTGSSLVGGAAEATAFQSTIDRLASAIGDQMRSPQTLLWLAVGASAAICFTGFTFGGGPEAGTEA